MLEHHGPDSPQALRDMPFMWNLFQFCLVLPLGCAFTTFALTRAIGVNDAYVASWVTFLSLFAIYVFDRVFETDGDIENHAIRSAFFKRNKVLLKLTASAALILSIGLGFLGYGIYGAGFALLPFIAVILYSIGGAIPVGRFRLRIPQLKKIPGVKNLTVAITLSTLITGLSAVAAPIGVAIPLLLILWAFLLLRFLINTITFDLRDIAGDTAAGTRTIATLWGKNQTLRMLHGLNCLIGGGLIVVAILYDPATRITLWLLPSSLFTASYLWWIGSRPVKNVVYDILVDGEITFWGLLICASSLI